ncbi:MAG: hypothetical protein R3261_01240, partial [Alphaproteobacteria bacterium]|nr:hypothetical protein [Alphaproteobacteria bacterium]
MSPLQLGMWSFIFCFIYFGAVPSIRAEGQQDLQQLQSRIQKETRLKEFYDLQARVLQLEAVHLRRDLIEAARQTQNREALIEDLQQDLQNLRDDVAYRRKKLQERRGQLSATLGALTKLSDENASAFFLFPGTPRQSVQSAMLLKSAVPTLKARADILREELDGLFTAENEAEARIQQMADAATQLEEDQNTLKQLLNRKQRIALRSDKQRQAAQQRVEKFVKEAKSLQELLNQLNKIRPAPRPEIRPEATPEGAAKDNQTTQAALTPPAVSDFAMVRPEELKPFPDEGRLPYPAKGRVVQRYGQDLGFGQTAKGIKIRTRPAAQLVTPHDGQVVFSG